MDRLPHTPELLIVMVLAIVVEILWRLRTNRGYDRADAWTSLRIGAGNLIFGVLASIVFSILFTYLSRFAPVHWPLGDWRTWVAGFILVEFAYYWFHRLSHTIRWMWASHIVHHSTEQLTFLSAIRLGWTNLISAGWVVYLPVILAGFDARLVLAILAFDLRFQFFLHTEAPVRLGPLEWVLNTPTHHQLHHACNAPYLDKNYGGVLIIFDRMFGTFAAARPEEPMRYGLAHPLPSKTTLGIALGEWRRMIADMRSAPNIGSALRAAVGRP